MTKVLKYRYLIVLLLLVVFVEACKSGKDKPMTKAEQAILKENLVKANKGLVSVDQDRIESYVSRRNWDMNVSETGMWYQILSSTLGDSAKVGKVAHLKYQVNLLDGTVCYTSDSTGNLVFKIAQGGVESGLEEAVRMMKVNDKGRFVLPPHLAHGLLGDDDKIPPRSIIVYQVELLKLTEY